MARPLLFVHLDPVLTPLGAPKYHVSVQQPMCNSFQAPTSMPIHHITLQIHIDYVRPVSGIYVIHIQLGKPSTLRRHQCFFFVGHPCTKSRRTSTFGPRLDVPSVWTSRLGSRSLRKSHPKSARKAWKARPHQSLEACIPRTAWKPFWVPSLNENVGIVLKKQV